jgi:hypothetical protein
METIEGSTGELKLSLDQGCCLKSDIPYEGHSRGTNFCAKIWKDPKSPGGLGREFCSKACGDYAYDLATLSVNDVIEIANDYTSGGGRRSRIRHFYIVCEICATGEEDQYCWMQEFDTAAKAFIAQKALKGVCK